MIIKAKIVATDKWQMGTFKMSESKKKTNCVTSQAQNIGKELPRLCCATSFVLLNCTDEKQQEMAYCTQLKALDVCIVWLLILSNEPKTACMRYFVNILGLTKKNITSVSI